MRKKQRSAYLLESLEARLLFSADLAPLPVDGGTSGADFESDLEILLQPDSAGVQEADEKRLALARTILADLHDELAEVKERGDYLAAERQTIIEGA